MFVSVQCEHFHTILYMSFLTCHFIGISVGQYERTIISKFVFTEMRGRCLITRRRLGGVARDRDRIHSRENGRHHVKTHFPVECRTHHVTDPDFPETGG